jgi:pimeloyl-ACP methyl ester carboxylesterase
MILIILASVLAVVGCAVGSYLVVIRHQSQAYDLVTLTEKDLPPRSTAVEDDYVQLSDVRMHYVRYGEGAQPVILIHGNSGNADSLKELAQYLAADYTVYCLDSRCQGKSSDPGVITYDLMAKDVYEFITAKLTVTPYVLGHSDGGIVAITLASLYPDCLAACMPCGANSRPDRFKWYFTFAVKMANMFHKDKLNDLMLELPDFTPEFLAGVTVPTYVVAGEYDIMPLSDSVYIHQHIAGSRLSIVKGAGHSSYITKHGGRIYQLAHAFFAEQAREVPLTD